MQAAEPSQTLVRARDEAPAIGLNNDSVHMYLYYSADPNLADKKPAWLYLHKKQEHLSLHSDGDTFRCTQTVEFISTWTGMTEEHGHWTLFEDGFRLNVDFNSQEGVVPLGHGRPRPLHMTKLWRVDVPRGPDEVACWIGDDDKGWEIQLVHVRSICKVRKTSGAPKRAVMIAPL
jgi:hypothetical protein